MSRLDPAELHPEFRTEPPEPSRSITDYVSDDVRSLLRPTPTFTTVFLSVVLLQSATAVLTIVGMALDSVLVMLLSLFPFFASVLVLVVGPLVVIRCKLGPSPSA